MINKMAKSVYSFLQKSATKDIALLVKGNKYTVTEYEDEIEGDFNSWDTLIVEFDYSEKELPTLEHIEKTLYNIFKKKLK